MTAISMLFNNLTWLKVLSFLAGFMLFFTSAQTLSDIMLSAGFIKIYGMNLLFLYLLIFTVFSFIFTSVYINHLKSANHFAVLLAISIIFLLLSLTIYFFRNQIEASREFFWLLFLLTILAKAIAAAATIPILDYYIRYFLAEQMRYFTPILNLSGIIGLSIGGLSATAFSGILGTFGLSLVLAANFAITAILAFTAQHMLANLIVKEETKSATATPAHFSLWKAIKDTPYIFLQLANRGIFSFLLVYVDYIYVKDVNRFFGNSDIVASVMGVYAWVASLLVAVFILFIGNPMLSYLGVAHATILAPCFLILSHILMFSFVGIWPVFEFRLTFDILNRGVYNLVGQFASNAVPMAVRKPILGLTLGVVAPLGTGISAVLLYLLSNFMSFEALLALGFVFNALWLLFLIRTKDWHIQALVKNVRQVPDRQTFFNALESMRDSYEPTAYEALRDILFDEQKYSDTTGILKTIEIMSQLKDYRAIRPISLLLSHQNLQIRLAAIIAIRQMKIKLDDVAKFYLVQQMTDLLRHDPVTQVRVEAGKLLMEYIPKKEWPDFIYSYLIRTEHPEEKIMIIEMLGNIKARYIDLLVVHCLEDRNPMVISAVILALERNVDYKQVLIKELDYLLGSEKFDDRRYGLITLIRSKSARFNSFIKEITSKQVNLESFPSEGENLHIRALAQMLILKDHHIKDERKNESIQSLIQILSSEDYSSENRKEFISLLPFIPETVLDELVSNLTDLPSDVKERAFQGFDALASYLSSKWFEKEDMEAVFQSSALWMYTRV